MLKKLILENWKSFRYAELPIDPLTVLIGTNASGKSNALDAIEFLSRTARGEDIPSALEGNSAISGIRGGSEWAALKPNTQFTLKALIQGEDERTDYLYSITIATSPKVQLLSESLIRYKTRPKTTKSPYRTLLFQLSFQPEEDLFLINLHKSQTDIYSKIPRSILRFITAFSMQKDIVIAISAVVPTLENIFVLDAIPSKMRSYSSISNSLQGDASNIAGVLASLPKQQKSHIESSLSAYVTHLPERDIKRVWAEAVGRFHTDAMLYCEEAWISGEKTTVIDARGMSDGTLRFLAILTALLTRPEGSQLVIEEVDNGLHPSRADLLLKMLREIGEQRHIDILVTTHNPALLNALEPEMIPFVLAAHRDSQTGESKLTPLEDLENLPKLMASGPLGKLAEQGSIERSLSGA